MNILSFIFVFLVDFCILPLTLFATVLFELVDIRKWDILNYDSTRKTIILIHGSGNNHSEWIVARMMLLWKYNVFSFNYAGLFSNDSEDVPAFYTQSIIRREINLIKHQTGCNEFILIGHSMGGLISVDYAKNIAPNDGIKISKIMTISSPWNGAPLAHLKSGRRYKDMTPNSEYLEGLKAFSSHPDVYSVASTYDWAVPFERGLLNQSKCKLYTWYGHYSIIISPFVWRDIITHIK